jgi:hypothetical protein
MPGGPSAVPGPYFKWGPDRPVDRSAVSAALKSVVYKDCGNGGVGKVMVTFAGSGDVVRVRLTGPFDAATSECIIARFRSAKIPPYDGAAPNFGVAIHL